MSTSPTASPFRQPKAVWAVAFACVISFMGIGLVDPILPAAGPAACSHARQVSLLFTSYLLVTAVAMLVTGWVSSRIGAKATLITGLALIVVFAALAGASDRSATSSASGPAGARQRAVHRDLAGRHRRPRPAAGSPARSSSTRRRSASASRRPAARRPARLISWRGPFFGVAVLMAIALIATAGPADPHAQARDERRLLDAAQGAAPPRPADHGLTACLQLGLLHHARLRAVPDGADALRARPGVLRLGPAGRDLHGVRRAPRCRPVRHRAGPVRQPRRCSRSLLRDRGLDDTRRRRHRAWSSPAP